MSCVCRKSCIQLSKQNPLISLVFFYLRRRSFSLDLSIVGPPHFKPTIGAYAYRDYGFASSTSNSSSFSFNNLALDRDRRHFTLDSLILFLCVEVPYAHLHPSLLVFFIAFQFAATVASAYPEHVLKVVVFLWRKRSS